MVFIHYDYWIKIFSIRDLILSKNLKTHLLIVTKRNLKKKKKK